MKICTCENPVVKTLADDQKVCFVCGCYWRKDYGSTDPKPVKIKKRGGIIARQKIGRNAFCLCGSMKKWKKCCGSNEWSAKGVR